MNATLGTMDLLSEKLGRHLAPEDWQTLFNGPGRSTIRFSRRTVTLLYAQPVALSSYSPRLRESFMGPARGCG